MNGSIESWVNIDSKASYSNDKTIEEEDELMLEISSGKQPNDRIMTVDDEFDSQVEERHTAIERLFKFYDVCVLVLSTEDLSPWELDSHVRELLRNQPMKQRKLNSFFV